MTIFEKETRHWLYVFIKKKTIGNLAKYKTTAGTRDRFGLLTQA